MINELEVPAMKKSLDDIKRKDENGNEYWDAHDLAKALGYSQYQKFKPAIDRVIKAFKKSGENSDYHLTQSSELIDVGKGATKKVSSYKMDRKGCYMASMNADPNKDQVAFAQQYFIINTRKLEVLEEHIHDLNRIEARDAMRAVNKNVAGVLRTHDVPDDKIGIVMDAADKGFFNNSTANLKLNNGIKPDEPIADYMDTDALVYNLYGKTEGKNKIIREDIRGVNDTSNTMYSECRRARNNMIDSTGMLPENSFVDNIGKIKHKANSRIEKGKKNM